MSLERVYYSRCSAKNYKPDEDQIRAIESLQHIYNNIIATPKKPFIFGKKLYVNVKGIYIWGGVGRGKTFIMDLFYNYLPKEKKLRQHFNHFMQMIHNELKLFKGQRNTLNKIAYKIAKKYRVICFDEFYVEDVADAMILGKLFTHLFDFGVTLVCTSNIVPRKLYQGGLQRELFLPAIEALEKNIDVLNLDLGVDYRKQKIPKYLNYYISNKDSYTVLAKRFNEISQSNTVNANQYIDVHDRRILATQLSIDAIWFDFNIICGYGRGAADYIALCQAYSVIIINDIPAMDDNNNDFARRFISLVDEAYDQRILLIVSAEVDIDFLYEGKLLSFAFERTKSRMLEMQSLGYFGNIENV